MITKKEKIYNALSSDERLLDLSSAQLKKILDINNDRYIRKIIAEYRTKNNTKRSYVNKETEDEILDNKKYDTLSYKEIINNIKNAQSAYKKSSKSNKTATISIKTKSDIIILQPLSDIHIGAMGTNYELIEQYTDLLNAIPNLYTCFIGDLCDNFVNFKSVSAMHGQLIPPATQARVLEEWLMDINHKILFSTWSNHDQMEENKTGYNTIKRILQDKTLYLNTIAKAEIFINDILYKVGVTHKTRYWSSFNTTHGLKQLSRKDLPNLDIYIAGDRHVPAFECAYEQGMKQTYIQLGTFKEEDSWSNQYFSISTSTAMPCLTLDTRTHNVTVFWSIEEAIQFCNGVTLNNKTNDKVGNKRPISG